MKTTLFEQIKALCKEASLALNISEGEFWVWFGHPLLLCDIKKENHS